MASLNRKVPTTHVTHEGAPAKRINAVEQLRRSVMCCMLWENSFYEDGDSIADRIKNTIPLVEPELVAEIAIEAREKMKLRHVPLLIVREMARIEKSRYLVSLTLQRIIQRADELCEFVAIYWKEKRQPLSAQVKKGLAAAFQKFSKYQLAKYNRDSAVKLRDVLFLSHAKPKDEEQKMVWKQLVDGTLQAPETWEVSLSAGKNKKETWERLLSEKKLGALALLRNLRNMKDVGVSKELVFSALDIMNVDRVFPYRFISAAKHAPQWEDKLEAAMFKCLENKKKLSGKTVLLIDVSDSMNWGNVSKRSDIKRWEAAAGLAILAREICEDCSVYTFDTSCRIIPSRRGFALRDIIGQRVGGGTNTGDAVHMVNNEEKYDRLIIFTDEQSHQQITNPTGRGYVVNIASYQNGIGYGKWVHVDGWSEAILDYIAEYETFGTSCAGNQAEKR